MAWGGINGLYQIIGEILQPLRNRMVALLHLNRDSLGHKLMHVAGTFILIDFSWIFFRAVRFKEAFGIIKSMLLIKNPWVLFDGSIYNCGLDAKNFWLMVIGIDILLFADFCKHKKIIIRKIILKQDFWFREIFIVCVIGAILLFGIWGPAFNKANFIYFQF